MISFLVTNRTVSITLHISQSQHPGVKLTRWVVMRISFSLIQLWHYSHPNLNFNLQNVLQDNVDKKRGGENVSQFFWSRMIHKAQLDAKFIA